VFGPEGRRVQVILLDTRFFRSPLSTGPRRVGGPYVRDDDPAKTMLGQRQWEWLEKQLREPAELRVIASSIQFAAEAAGQETWSNLPRQRTRLMELLKTTEANGVLFVSGDRHWAELSAIREGADYPLYDMTSSSFNQIHERGTPTKNRFRVIDNTYHRENYGVILIDWQAADPTITLSIRDITGATQLEKRIRLSELRAK
jgi:alkaline phosphatase D